MRQRLQTAGLNGWRAVIARLRPAVASGDPLLVLSDYDGTLTPIVDDPRDASLGRRSRELAGLARCKRVRLGIVSGRRLDDLRRCVGLRGLIYAGCHGLELSGPGMAFRHPAAVEAIDRLRRLIDEVQARTAVLPGVAIERKVLAAAVHYRQAPASTVATLFEIVATVVGADERFRLLPGRKVIDILPAVAWDKGACIRWIEATLGTRISAMRPMYFGDDATDETAFRVLDGSGLTIKVGGRACTAAQQRVGSVSDVYRILRTLRALLERSES